MQNTPTDTKIKMLIAHKIQFRGMNWKFGFSKIAYGNSGQINKRKTLFPVDDEARGDRLRQLPHHADDPVAQEPERGARLQRVRPLPQASQRKFFFYFGKNALAYLQRRVCSWKGRGFSP
jgi:hypothetical protein